VRRDVWRFGADRHGSVEEKASVVAESAVVEE
jgi:hypothetical protein